MLVVASTRLATPIEIVMRKGTRVAVIGVLLGSTLAFAVSGAIQPLLFNQSARDPMVFSVVAGALLVVAILATLAPALRASRADPNTALRSD